MTTESTDIELTITIEKPDYVSEEEHLEKIKAITSKMTEIRREIEISAGFAHILVSKTICTSCIK